jgi:heptaprenylglyceryl phosphate synthase
MTKKTLSIILFFAGISVCLSQSYNLEIEINNVEIDGVIYMAIYNNSDRNWIYARNVLSESNN